MYRYIIKRLLYMIPIIIGVSFLIYIILNFAPGDIATIKGAEADMNEQQVAALRAAYGLDKPLIIRYLKYLSGLVRGDMGTSYITKQPVFYTCMHVLPATLKMAFSSIVVSILFAIPLGIYSAKHAGTLRDNASMVFALLGVSMPTFWLGLMLIILFGVKLRWLPAGGDEGFLSLILPAITIGASLTATLTRTTRSSMLDVLRQEYLRTARAKGVSEKLVVNKHALKNALIPILTIVGNQLSICLGGSMLTETVFTWPGIGRLIIDSIRSRDTPMVTGCIITTTIMISFTILIVDLLYAVVDPRIKSKYQGKARKV